MSEEVKTGRIPPDEQLLLAVQKGSPEDAKKVLSSGFDVNHKDREGNTAIFFCSTSNQSKVLRYLISMGANINAVNKLGNTALHYAVEKGCMEIILILMLNGADPTITNQANQKPEDLNPKIRPMLIALTNDRQIFAVLNDNHKKKLMAIFEDIDRDATGILNLEKSLRFNRYMEDVAVDVARRDAQDFLRDVGICHGGQINLDEWLFSFAKLAAECGNDAVDQFIDDYERIGREKGKYEDFVPKD